MTPKKKVVKAAPPIPRKTLLVAIRESLDTAIQWQKHGDNPEWAAISVKYLHGAEALIEVLEVDDCGSTGGYDGHGGSESLEERLKWLCEKYGHTVPSRHKK